MLKISTYDGDTDKMIGEHLSGYTVTFIPQSRPGSRRQAGKEGDLPDFELGGITWSENGQLMYRAYRIVEDENGLPKMVGGKQVIEVEPSYFPVDDVVLVVY